jgi:hypothetical protein
MMEHLQFMDTDVFTYTTAGEPLINLSWLYQLQVYGMWKIGGYGGLALWQIFIALAVFLVQFWRMKLRAMGSGVVSVLLFVLLLQIENRFNYRPELLTWLYLSIFFLILERNDRKPETGLFLLPLIMLLWVNSHSLFILGLVVVTAYGISWIIERKLSANRARWLGATLAIPLFNPYGMNGALFPLS